MTRSGSRTKRGGAKKETRKTGKESETNEENYSYNNTNGDNTDDGKILSWLWESQFETPSPK